MSVRRVSLAGAAVDLAGLLGATTLGGFAAPIWALALCLLAHTGLWWALRRRTLAALADPAPAIVGALGVLVAAQAGAYGLSLMFFSSFR